MKRLRELTDPSELKQGMLLLTVDHDHNESVDLIEGIERLNRTVPGMVITINFTVIDAFD